jgi:hypothetical protein
VAVTCPYSTNGGKAANLQSLAKSAILRLMRVAREGEREAGKGKNF